jgi:hypothetical protein
MPASQHFLDFRLLGTVENRRRKGHTRLEVAGHLDDLAVAQLIEVFRLAVAVVDLLEETAHLGRRRLPTQHLADLETEALGGQPEMDLENLSDVHP